MECDSIHSTIERKLRNKPIYCPQNYIDLIKDARPHQPYDVKYLSHEFFGKYSELKYYSSIRPGNRVGDPVVTNIRVLKYTEDGSIQYKLDFSDQYQDLPRRSKVGLPSVDDTIERLYLSQVPIKKAKYQHLQELKAVIPRDFHPFYDRQFQSQNTNKLKKYSVQELRSYLLSRLIAATKFNKRKLIELAEYAHDLKLEIIEEDDYKDLCKERRRISTKEGQSHYVIDVSEVTDWTVDLRRVPSVETGDIIIYLFSTCQWSDDRLRDYKQHNGYKLYMCKHISDMKLYKTDTLGYMYVHANCVPETRQSADPYNTWVLMDSTGYLKSGGCTCVA
ncbi:unnamed protein product [Mytilus edulis]|uniref:Uncharacterized protein n=1 Tax=Mytilus edulis TaxID=6550 RepID=A0A8S3VDU9_MYTED|nr:unnamed protein product [Mytilus edulis]